MTLLDLQHVLRLSTSVATIVILLPKQVRQIGRVVHLNRLGEIQIILLLLDLNHVFQILHVPKRGLSLLFLFE